MSFTNAIRRGRRGKVALALGGGLAVVVDGDTLLVGAGTTGFFKNPHFQLIAYSLP